MARGEQDIHSDRAQRLTDLRRAGVVEGDRLNDLGNAVVEAFRQHRAGDSSPTDGVSLLTSSGVLRCALLSREALKAGSVHYTRYVANWQELRRYYEALELLSNPWLLYAFSFYNHEIEEFNPWHALRGLSADAFKLVDVAGTNPMQSTINQRIQGLATRPTGRIEFCAAIECTLTNESRDRRELLEALQL